MRTRSNVQPPTSTALHFTIYDEYLKKYTTNSSYSVNTTERSETIVDTLGYKEQPCFHTKVVLTPPGPQGMYTVTSGIYSMTFDGYGLPRYNLAISAIDNNEIYPLLTKDDCFEHANALFQSCLPEIKSQFGESAALAIRELPTLKSGAKRLARDLVRTRARLLARGISSYSKYKKLAKTVAGANLFAQFGIIPLIQDTKSMLLAWQSATKQYRDLLRKQKVWRTARRRYFEKVSDTTSTGYIGYDYWSRVGHTNEVNYEYRQVLEVDVTTVSVRYRFTMPPLPRRLGEFLSFLDYLGINLNPKILWDGTRLSFLVDWILNVGDVLDTFKLNNIHPYTELHKVVCSRHRTSRYEFKLTNSAKGDEHIQSARKESYVRLPYLPPIHELKLNGDLDWFKVHIGSSLLVQQLKD